MTIICLIGPSGSGKSTIATEMEQFGIPQIVSFTTRKMRPDETDGVGHYFISEQEAQNLLSSYRPLAYTKFGGQHYFALFNQLRYYNRPQPDIVSYVIDEYGYLGLASNVADHDDRMRFLYGFHDAEPIHLLPIYIERQEIAGIDAERLQRDNDRIELPEGTIKVRISNDAPTLPALRAWSKDFAEAISAYLTVCDAATMPPATHSIYTSQPGVSSIISAISEQ